MEVFEISELNISERNLTASDYTERLRNIIAEMSEKPKCYIRTFGCQQNVSDSERIAGLMESCGYEITDSHKGADLIIFNTCAVREHAEFRVFGNIGALKKLKEDNKNLVIAVGGCMVHQKHVADKLKASYPYVDIIFNTNELQRLPEHLAKRLGSKKSVVACGCKGYSIYESLPVRRDGEFRAFIPIMYGCDNFCTYCVVPFVRGRERSRTSEEIIKEFKEVVGKGYKDIMLLGQNVNSYGKKLDEKINFSELLRRLNAIEGDFKIRFMTSHPKDATKELFDTIAACEKVSRHIHLPVQSGSDGILKKMNRRYTSADYLKLIEYAKKKIDGVTFSSDIIVGFPGETLNDFKATEELVKTVGFRSIFTFIFSPRVGTAAEKMTDHTPHDTKAKRLNELVALQEVITEEQDAALIGKTVWAHIVGELSDGLHEARLDDNSAVTVSGECALNEFVNIEITESSKKRLYGKVK